MKRNFISSEMSYKTYLKQLYFDPVKPGSYGSVNKLYRAVRKEGKYVLGKSKIKNGYTHKRRSVFIDRSIESFPDVR